MSKRSEKQWQRPTRELRVNAGVVIAWIVLPVVVVVGLCWWIFYGGVLDRVDELPMRDAPRVGAGAGDTGGANAVGESFRERREAGAEPRAGDGANRAGDQG